MARDRNRGDVAMSGTDQRETRAFGGEHFRRVCARPFRALLRGSAPTTGLVILTLAFLSSATAGLTVHWTDQFGTTASDYAAGVSVGPSGPYVGGFTEGTVAGQQRMGGVDAFVRSYNESGGTPWTRQFGTQAADAILAVGSDSSGVFVAGWTKGTLPGQSRVVADVLLELLFGSASQDVFIRKYDAAGAVVWTQQFGTDKDDAATGIAVDPSGIYVTGNTDGALPDQTGTGSKDAFVRKYDAAGSAVWTRQFGTAAYEFSHGVAVHDGYVYAAGNTAGAFPGQTKSGDIDAFVRAYDSSGSELWTRQFGGAHGMAVAADGTGVYVAGFTWGSVGTQANAGQSDAFVRKYDRSGNVLWTQQLGTAALEDATGISVDASGVYVVGFTEGTLPGMTSAGSRDVYVWAFDGSGNALWGDQFGTAATDEAFAIAVGSSGIYPVGATWGAFPGQAASGGADGFVRRCTTG